MQPEPFRLGWRGRLLALVAAAVLLLVGVIVKRIAEERQMERPGWVLKWQDEFEGDGLDWFRWNAQDVISPRNRELQYYTPNEIRVANGRLRLSTDRAEFRDRAFTSGAVDTHGKFSFTYGRVEVRARLPHMGQGIWPAIWMLGERCNPIGDPCPWPTAGATEIDIMEAVNSPGTLYQNLHYGNSVGTSLSPGPLVRPVPNLSERFHTYTVEWEPEGRVRWYLDGEETGNRQVPGWFDQPMYLILSTAVGGDWPGPPGEGTRFPQHFDIEYVRVYKRT